MAETSFGKYKLIAELGHGGMADVFLAVQAGPAGSGFRKLTVVKRLRQNLAEEPEFVAMLVDEARIAARLNHPNVVQTNEVGQLNGQYFIAMEYLDGQPLHRIQHRSSQRLKDGGESPFPRELQYIVMMDVLGGLHHAHELVDYDGTPLQIVHRDMTPHNIFVTYEGQVKVVDFGIAKAAGRSSETRQGVIKGKVRYMAPEQAVGHNVDRRVDLFAVGIMLWEIATGRRMWRDMDDLQIVQALVSGDVPRSPKAVNPEVPDAIDRICTKVLAQNVDERYATAEDFRSDLEEYLTESGILAQGRRKMSAALNELFKDKRQELRSIIEKQLSDLELKGSGEFNAVALGASSTSIPSLPTSSASQSIETELPSSGTNQSQVMAAPNKTGTKLAAFGGAIIVAGLLVIGAVSLGLRASNKPVPVEADQTITLRVKGSPANARVRIDDGVSESLPLTTSVPRDGKEHKVHVEAEGYQAKDEMVTFSEDVVLNVDLAKADAPVVATNSAATTHVTNSKVPTPTPKWTPPTPVGHKTTPTAPAPTPTETAPPAASTSTPPTPTPTNTVTAAPTPAPTPTVDVAAEHRKAVNRTVRAHAGDVQACYDRAKMTTPTLGGVVTVGATLTASGSVASARIVSSTAHSTQLESCLVDRFRSWAFPPAPPGASNDVSYTFRFE